MQLTGEVEPAAVVRLIKQSLPEVVPVFEVVSLSIADTPELRATSRALEQHPMPFIAVCSGQISGGALVFPTLATIALAHDSAEFSHDAHVSSTLASALRHRIRRAEYQSEARRDAAAIPSSGSGSGALLSSRVVISAQQALLYGLVDFTGSAEATEAELSRFHTVLAQIPPKLMRICRDELPASSLETAMLTMGALDMRGRERDDDEVTDLDRTRCAMELSLTPSAQKES